MPKAKPRQSKTVFEPGTGPLFEDVLKARDVKVPVPASLSSAEWLAVSGELRERALFSARVLNAEFLDKFDGLAREIIQGEEGLAGARMRLGEYLQEIGYQSPVGKALTIEDLASEGRLNLILKTNVQQAQGYAWYEQSRDPVILDEWPCQELVRVGQRRVPRDDWPERWVGACQAAGDKKALAVFAATGRMIARKDSGVWQALGNGEGGAGGVSFDDTLGTPYPPFAFNSGMGVEDVSRDDAVALGLLSADDQIEMPEDRGFNDDLEATPQIRSDELREKLLDELGPEYEFDGDKLVRA